MLPYRFVAPALACLLLTPNAQSPTPIAQRPNPNTQYPTPNTDASRLVRVWDIRAGQKPGENPYTRTRDPGDRMILSASVAPADLPLLASAGFTLFQTDSDHLSTEEIAAAVWEFSRPDADMRLVHERGLDWCYFPHYAFPPKWYRDQYQFTRIQCLEHDQWIQAYSPWDIKWPAFVSRGYQQISDLFGVRNPQSAIRNQVDALYLGIHGDYGECGVFMGARISVPGQREDWIRRFGNQHNHIGWWCGDPLARASFRDAMVRKYHDLDVLNAAWKTRYRKPADIDYPPGSSPTGIARRRWLDFVEWYQLSISGLADTVSRAARRRFPETLMMLPAGFGDENPRGGNDNSLIPKIAAKHRVDVRSTHGGFKSFAASQATMMGRIASACRFYDVPFWTEPPGRLTPDVEVGRIFTAASFGAKGFFDWADNVRENRDLYYRYNRYLKVEKPVVDVAMFYPTASHLLRPDIPYPQTFEKGCTEIRDVLNYDVVAERMIQDGALDRYRILVMWEGPVVETETLSKIKDWVQAGGTLAAYDFGKIETVEGDRAWFNDLFGYAGKLNPASTSLRYVPASGESPPASYRINIGDPASARFLGGDWYEPDTIGGVARRWTGASAEITMPLDPARQYGLSVRASFPPEAVRKRHEVFVNGKKVGEIDQAADTTYRFPMPVGVLSGSTATASIRSQTWTPADAIPGSTDKRALGVSVTYVQLDPEDRPPVVDAPALTGKLETVIDLKRLRSEWAHPYGRGWTVYFPATRRLLAGYHEVVRYLTYHLSDLDPVKQDAIAVDDAWDGIYATLLTDKILYYNPGAQTVNRSIVLSPAAFADRRDVVKPASFTNNLKLDPVSISAIYFGAPPQELLLQCEKFTGLGNLHPLTGPGFSPGTGITQVLIPTGGQIGTRFQCDVPGAYRVFYRAIRRGGQARAEVSIDGKIPESPTTLRPAYDATSRAETLLAGTLNLTAGIHSLTVRPRRGEDIRADFVILATDPTIAGYSFAVRTK